MTKIFLRGLAVILPMTVTAYVLYWLVTTAERSLGAGLRLLLSDLYVPGMGVVAGTALVFAVGVLTRLWLTRKLITLGEGVVDRIPLIKTVYGSVRDLMSFFSGEETKKLDQVVLVTLMDDSTQLLGFLTRDRLEEFEGLLGDEDKVAVYLPMSYQIGGYTLMVPRSRVQPTDMSIEHGMRFAMTAGVSAEGPSRAARGRPRSRDRPHQAVEGEPG